MLRKYTAVLATASIMAGTLFFSTVAPAQNVPDTPEHQRNVKAAVVRLLTAFNVTPDMVEKIDLCRYRINRPEFGAPRTFDFTLLDDVVAHGQGLAGNLNGPKADIYISAAADNPQRGNFTCKEGAPCEDLYIIEGANNNQFAEAHVAAGDLVYACSKGATYRTCTSGGYNAFQCAP